MIGQLPRASDIKNPLPEEIKEKIIWREKSEFGRTTLVVFGLVWVLTLGLTPLSILATSQGRVTYTGLALSSAMWLALFGGLYLFTQIIHFQSPHFQEVRSLNLVESCYFMTQIITTVGYGDITPAYTAGQLVVGIYVMVAFFVIALLMSEMQAVVMRKVNHYKDMLKKSTGYHKVDSPRTALAFRPEKPSPLDFLCVLSLFVLVAVVWMVFFHVYPEEKKTWEEAAYMALITLSTVGFGAVTPVTEGGMMFSAYFMFVGTGVLVSLLTHFSTFSLQLVAWEAWDPNQFQTDIQNIHTDLKGGQKLSEEEFLILTLVHKDIVSQEQVDCIKRVYADISVSHPVDGGVTPKSIWRFAGVTSPAATPRHDDVTEMQAAG